MSDKCKICGFDNLDILYKGRIRVGKFGQYTGEEKTIYKCPSCFSGQLHDKSVDYESTEYRDSVDGTSCSADYYKLHDAEQAEKISVLGTDAVRGKILADIGCGAGAFLDFMKGVAKNTIAVEPAKTYHTELRSKGHAVYSYADALGHEWRGKIDIITVFAVIEHIENPLKFLLDLKSLLAPNGRILLSTPNSEDWLIRTLPKTYAAFFYRCAHLFYFSLASLEKLAERCGMKLLGYNYVQQYDLGNALLWLRDGKPSGKSGLRVLNGLDSAYKNQCEKEGVSNFVYAWIG